MRLRLMFGEMPGGRRLSPGHAEVDDEQAAHRPIPALVAEAVEAHVRRGIENGAHRSVQVEPHGHDEARFQGVVYLGVQGAPRESFTWTAEKANPVFVAPPGQ